MMTKMLDPNPLPAAGPVDDEDTVAAEESTSSFSLQECINEFRTRRIRRSSNQSHIDGRCAAEMDSVEQNAAEDDIAQQNQSNKQQERNNKPCKDGFCYCFSSDSGGGADALYINRAAQLRHMKRAKRSEPAQLLAKHASCEKLKKNRSPPVGGTRQQAGNITAIGRLKTSCGNAPLIQIIQELHHNCVISEVRVNDKLITQSQQRRIDGVRQTSKPAVAKEPIFAPTAPPLSQLTDNDSPMNSSVDSVGKKRARRSSSSGGKLLQKRLSNNSLSFKQLDPKEPPPKPPRRSHSSDAKTTTDSASSSIRQAERVVDNFLLKRGFKLPQPAAKPAGQTKKYTKNEHTYEEDTSNKYQPSPTCPSLSEFECSNKNHGRVSPRKTKSVALGWQEPKIAEMLNYDAAPAGTVRPFHKVGAMQSRAEPQSAGFQIPSKLSIDTVDCVRQNLATNMEQKKTPVKTQLFAGASKPKTTRFALWQPKNKTGDKKSQLKTSSKRFLANSKDKFLRFVSPKKLNVPMQQAASAPTTSRTIGVQTSHAEVDSMPLHSPPGSYHSPLQSCVTTSTPTVHSNRAHIDDTNKSYFDFTRHVQVPRPTRRSNRKLEFPLCNHARSCLAKRFNCTDGIDSYEERVDWFRGAKHSKTYHSYQQELEQHDHTFSKMGSLLSNIRARLEASDNHAVRIFEDIDVDERVDKSPEDGIDCVDGFVASEQPTPPDQDWPTRRLKKNCNDTEPLYSEIEDSLVQMKSSDNSVDSKQRQQRSRPTLTPDELNLLYAKVNKTPKKSPQAAPPKPLAQLLQDSLQHGTPLLQRTPLLTVFEHPTTESQTYSTLSPRSSKYQSLNNIYERHSPPKRISNLSKSDLSLNRSDIFLENLRHADNYPCSPYSKPNNDKQLQTSLDELAARIECQIIEDDRISYDTPEPIYETLEAARSPKPSVKPAESKIVVSKNAFACEKSKEAKEMGITPIPDSCPATPKQRLFKQPSTKSLNSIECAHNGGNVSPISAPVVLARCKRLKSALKKSYAKGKHFFTASTAMHNAPFRGCSEEETANRDVVSADALLNIDENVPATDQLAQAVTICRRLPELEISPEMVEAERLLLYSKLKQNIRDTTTKASAGCDEQKWPSKRAAVNTAINHFQRFYVDVMELPVKSNLNEDIFFNYYYICTFEYNGGIKSTQSAECHNGKASFKDCGIELTFEHKKTEDVVIECQVYMLRLRKVSTLQKESTKKQEQKIQRSASSTSSSSNELITSRFRLHATFSLNAQSFAPYEFVASESHASGKCCLRAANVYSIPLRLQNKSTNLSPVIKLTARADVRVPATKLAGFLNVQDPKILHSWNRRWCEVDCLRLNVWRDKEHSTDGGEPLLSLELQASLYENYPLTAAPRELCARPRSFCLKQREPSTSECFENVLFSAETQDDLNNWLQVINQILEFITVWLN